MERVYFGNQNNKNVSGVNHALHGFKSNGHPTHTLQVTLITDLITLLKGEKYLDFGYKVNPLLANFHHP